MLLKLINSAPDESELLSPNCYYTQRKAILLSELVELHYEYLYEFAIITYHELATGSLRVSIKSNFVNELLTQDSRLALIPFSQRYRERLA